MEMTLLFRSLTNLTTGENLLKYDTVTLSGFSKDSLDLEMETNHSFQTGNLITLDLFVSLGLKECTINIMGKITEHHSYEQNSHFTLKLTQYNSDAWSQILLIFNEKQANLSTIFKRIRG